MKLPHYIVFLSVAALLLGPVAGLGAPSIVFSVDDLPVMPIMPPAYPIGPPPIGLGAEDPFGMGFIGVPLAPSPSIPAVPPMYGPTWDSTILQSGKIMGAPFPDQHLAPTIEPMGMFPLAYVNAMSRDGHEDDRQEIPLSFSVDRISTGLPGTAVCVQANLNQQPGDIFTLPGVVPNPTAFIGALLPNAGYVGNLPTAGMGPGTNTLMIDESQLTLTAMAAPGAMTPPNVAAMPIGPFTHDNLDAFAGGMLDFDGDGGTDWPYLISVNPDEAIQLNALYPGGPFWGFPFSAADMYAVMPGGPGANMIGPALPGIQFGLDALVGGANIDDIDALYVIWDPVSVSGPCALFSLGPGSGSLLNNNLSAADIFFTDFNGSFATFLTAGDIGLNFQDNVDALPEPATLSLLALGALAVLRRRRG